MVITYEIPEHAPITIETAAPLRIGETVEVCFGTTGTQKYRFVRIYWGMRDGRLAPHIELEPIKEPDGP